MDWGGGAVESGTAPPVQKFRKKTVPPLPPEIDAWYSPGPKGD